MGDGQTKGEQPVTISAPPAADVTIDPQNPLPEPSFKWRRILAYAVVIASLALTWHAAEALHDLGAADEILTLSKWTIGFAGLIATFYYIAPSAAELTSMIQSARIIKSSLHMADNAQQDATGVSERRLDRAESRAERRYERSVAGDSHFSEEAPDEAPVASGDDVDYAPKGRS